VLDLWRQAEAIPVEPTPSKNSSGWWMTIQGSFWSPRTPAACSARSLAAGRLAGQRLPPGGVSRFSPPWRRRFPSRRGREPAAGQRGLPCHRPRGQKRGPRDGLLEAAGYDHDRRMVRYVKTLD